MITFELIINTTAVALSAMGLFLGVAMFTIAMTIFYTASEAISGKGKADLKKLSNMINVNPYLIKLSLAAVVGCIMFVGASLAKAYYHMLQGHLEILLAL